MELSDSNSESLRSELARLQDRETTLSQLFSLERERRVRAEHLFEVERLACFQLGHQLVKQKVVYDRSSVSTKNFEDTNGHHTSMNKQSDDVCFKDTNSFKLHNAMNGGVLSMENSSNIMSSNLLPLLSEDDFASSIFSQLPTDLQHMLGVGDKEEAKEEEALLKARMAVLANDPDTLHKYIVQQKSQNHNGKSLLETSCELGHEGCIRVLLEAGWSPNEPIGQNKMTPLHICAKLGHLNSLKILLEFGADPNVKDESDQTPIFLALSASHETTVQSLLQAGASLTVITKDDHSLLHAAVLGNLPHTLRVLLTHLQASLKGAEFKQLLNSSDNSGSTPLHFAVSGGHRECVGILCACEDVSVGVRDRWNRTPMVVATDEDVREQLRSREFKAVPVLVEPDPSNGQKDRLAIGQLHILSHHRLSDLEYLIDDLLHQYCQNLRGSSLCSLVQGLPKIEDTWASTGHAQTLSDRVRRESELAAALKSDSTAKQKYLKNCSQLIKNTCSRIAPLDLTSSSVASYRVGSIEWGHGELDRVSGAKTLLHVLSETQLSGRSAPQPMHVTVTLKGVNDGCLDQLAFELMVPLAKLQEYVDLIKQHKALIIHGSQGSGKTQLARALAHHIKAGKRRAQVVYTSLSPSFQRDDLFRLLHINGVLIQQKGRGDSETTYVVVLDDISSAQSVLAELLTFLEYRGPDNPMWVNDVYGRDGSLLYPCGHYYLINSVYFIATTNDNSNSAGGNWVEQFAHVSLDLNSSSGVLMRHLNARLVHTLGQLALHPSLPLCRMVWWVFQVWVLYNDFVRRIGIQKLVVGVRHFIQCPVKQNNPETISSWLVSLWTHHIAPHLHSTLLTSSPAPPSSQTHILQDISMISECLSACVELVFGPCCPLSYEAREQFTRQLKEVIEATGETEYKREKEADEQKGEQKAPHSMRPEKSSKAGPPTIPHPVHKPPLPPQPGSMVSYEDMLRDSPRNKAKHVKDKPRHNSTKNGPVTVEDNTVQSAPGVVLRQKSRKSTLRKLRSKTIGLFSSKDNNGTFSLPSKFFGKGSKQSIPASATSQDLTKSNSNGADKTKQLGGVLDLISSTSHSQFEDRRSPSPPTRAVSENIEDRRKDLDNFLDMLSSVNTSRIDEQRSPPPEPRFEPKKREVVKEVPKYTLPTGSPLRQASYKSHPSQLHTTRGFGSTPAFSSPDIVNDVEASSSSAYIVTHQPVQRRYTNTSVSSQEFDGVFYDDQSSCYSATTPDKFYSHHDSPQSEPGAKFSSKDRAKLHDMGTTSEPLKHKKPSHINCVNGHSPAKSTPLHARSPASPLTVAMYSSPSYTQHNSPSIAQIADSRMFPPSTNKLSFKASSVSNVSKADELGDIDDFDLFRAVSEGDLSAGNNETHFDFNLSTTQTYKNDMSNHDEFIQTPLRGSHKSITLKANSLKYHSSPISDSQPSSKTRSYSVSVNKKGGYTASNRRSSIPSAINQEHNYPTNSLRRGSDSGKGFGSNQHLFYSASLGFDSLSRLSSSRDRLSNQCGSLTEDIETNEATEM